MKLYYIDNNLLLIVRYYDDGDLLAKESYNHNMKREGITIFYYGNEQLSSISNYLNDFKNGLEQRYKLYDKKSILIINTFYIR